MVVHYHTVPVFGQVPDDFHLAEDDQEDSMNFPVFSSADEDFKKFGYLLDTAAYSNMANASWSDDDFSLLDLLSPSVSETCNSDSDRFSLMEVSSVESDEDEDTENNNCLCLSRVSPLKVDDDEPIAKRTRLRSIGQNSNLQMLVDDDYDRGKVMVNPLDISLHPEGTSSLMQFNQEMVENTFVQDPSEEISLNHPSPQKMCEPLSSPTHEMLPRAGSEKKDTMKKLVIKSESKNPRGRPRKRELPTDEEPKKPKKMKKEIVDEDNRKEFCIKCDKICDDRRFFVVCPSCDQKCHGKCVSLTEKRLKKQGAWWCDDCSDEPREVLYCLCKKPYDESLFYVGCDGCEDWFHPECVGTTQKNVESTNAGYLCPNCSKASQSMLESTTQESEEAILEKKRASRKEFPLLWRLWDVLVENTHSWPFRNPVDREKMPRYYEIIERPMDLDMMRRKLENNEYQSLKSFVGDACLIFDNTRQFYVKQNEIYQCADQLEKVFRSEIVRVSKDVDGHRSRVPSVLDIETDQLLGFGSDCNMDPSQFLEGLL